MPNLPPVLPTGNALKSSAPKTSGVNRAQDYSITKLQPQREREEASVSMGQAIARKAKRMFGGPKSSVSHVGQAQKTPSSSYAHAGREPVGRDAGGLYDEGADDRRWDHIRKLVRERKHKQKELEVKTGASFSKDGLKEQISKLVRKKPNTYNNISKKDKEVIANIIGKKAAHKSTAASFSSTDKRDMRSAAYKAKKQGRLSSADVKDFKRIVKDL